MSGKSRVEPTSREQDLVEMADAFETTEFSPVELDAIKRTRRRSPRLGEARATVQTFRGPPSLMDRVRRKAASDGTTESQVIRDALDAYLSPH